MQELTDSYFCTTCGKLRFHLLGCDDKPLYCLFCKHPYDNEQMKLSKYDRYFNEGVVSQ